MIIPTQLIIHHHYRASLVRFCPLALVTARSQCLDVAGEPRNLIVNKVFLLELQGAFNLPLLLLLELENLNKGALQVGLCHHLYVVELLSHGLHKASINDGVTMMAGVGIRGGST